MYIIKILILHVIMIYVYIEERTFFIGHSTASGYEIFCSIVLGVSADMSEKHLETYIESQDQLVFKAKRINF